MSKLIVFGGGGFIGQHLVRALARRQKDEIVAFDHFSKYVVGAEQPFLGLENVAIVPGDFLNRTEVSRVLEGADYVFHLVSTTNPAVSNKDPLIDIDTNVRGSIELFDLCVKHKVKRILFPSSGGTVYGDTKNGLISEDTVPQPRSPYGIGKLTIEHYLRYFKSTHGLDYIVYRIANPYGPGQNIYGKQGVIPIFMHKFLMHQAVTIYGDGSMARDYFYIDDLISMIADSYQKDHKFDEYNLGSGQAETVNELVKVIEACAGYTVKRNHIKAPPTFVQKSVLDISRFTDEFGVPDFTPLREGMLRTWEYVKELG